MGDIISCPSRSTQARALERDCASSLMTQIIKISVLVRDEIAVMQCVFLIALPSCHNDMHLKAPSSGITVKPLGHFARIAGNWYLHNSCALCCVLSWKILWSKPQHFSDFLSDYNNCSLRFWVKQCRLFSEIATFYEQALIPLKFPASIQSATQ